LNGCEWCGVPPLWQGKSAAAAQRKSAAEQRIHSCPPTQTTQAAEVEATCATDARRRCCWLCCCHARRIAVCLWLTLRCVLDLGCVRVDSSTISQSPARFRLCSAGCPQPVPPQPCSSISSQRQQHSNSSRSNLNRTWAHIHTYVHARHADGHTHSCADANGSTLSTLHSLSPSL
jgi:hypothetical protein